MPNPSTHENIAKAVEWLLEWTAKAWPIVPEQKERFGFSVQQACKVIGRANVARRQS